MIWLVSIPILILVAVLITGFYTEEKPPYEKYRDLPPDIEALLFGDKEDNQ